MWKGRGMRIYRSEKVSYNILKWFISRHQVVVNMSVMGKQYLVRYATNI